MQTTTNKEQDFIRAYEQYSAALFRHCCFKIANREVAKDLLQEAFMKTWLCIARGQEIKNIRAFLYKILTNLIIDEYRKKKPVSLDLMMEAGFDRAAASRAGDATKDLENQLDGVRALELLEKIPDAYHDVIFMRYVQELSLKEISAITGESQNALAVKIHRGIKKVKKLFDHEK